MNKQKPYFDEKGDLVILKDGPRKVYIPYRHCRLIYTNILAGKSIAMASPMMPITREEAGAIIAYFVDNC